MTTPAMRLNTAAWRIIVGLFAVAVVALLAPPSASASPESDADAAITAAWDASGGDGGPLGPREGGVYAAGAGFAQNLANGKIFFTPTPARTTSRARSWRSTNRSEGLTATSVSRPSTKAPDAHRTAGTRPSARRTSP